MGDPRELAPLLVTSPTVRSGTTLLQRLLCSSANALVYGEEIGKDLDLQLQIAAARRMVYEGSQPRFSSSLQRVLDGDGNDWLVDLMPDVDGYLAALQAGTFAGLAYCRDHATAAGRPLWGFKYPGWPPHLTRLLFEQLPATRVVFIVRGLADTARSAKAWGAVDGEAGMQAFCAQWLANLAFMRQWQRDHAVLMLPFETLVHDPEQALDLLRGFVPLEGLHDGVLGHRINNLTEAVGGTRPGPGYIEPAPLSPYEQACIDATVAAAATP